MEYQYYIPYDQQLFINRIKYLDNMIVHVQETKNQITKELEYIKKEFQKKYHYNLDTKHCKTEKTKTEKTKGTLV